MKNHVIVLVAVVLTATSLAGCLADDDTPAGGGIPIAVVTVTALQDQVDTFRFDASKSSGKGLKFDWAFGDGETSDESIAEHTYTYGSGMYPASLTITDLNGVKDVWTQEIKVGTGENLPPVADFTPVARYLAIGEPLTVDARATTDPQDDPIKYVWDFNHLMTPDGYLAFRDAKKTAVDDGDDGSAKEAIELPDPRHVTDLLSSGKSPGHDHGTGHDAVSAFNGRREATEPVFTLEEGFPDATTFYVRLTAYDVKGASAAIVSEQVWPVKVVDAREKAIYADSRTGTFTFGSGSTTQNATPDLEGTYRDEFKFTFEIPKPIETMYVNVTWDKDPAGGHAYDIDLDIEAPNGKKRHNYDGRDSQVNLTLNGGDDLGKGIWGVSLAARQGVNYEFTVSYWARVNLDPFADIEAPYKS